MQNNGGAYGTIRIGTPDLPAPDTDNHNESIRIANNRIVANGGTNLAGGIGIFAGADNYEVATTISAATSRRSTAAGSAATAAAPTAGSIDNRIYFNRSYDEGGGIMIAGELPANPVTRCRRAPAR